MIRTSIDIGSNSVLLLSVVWNGKIEKELLNLSHITSLGKDLDKTKMLHPDSLKATYEALLDYKTKLSQLNIDPCEVMVTATEAARVALNAQEFFDQIKKDLGFEVKIITGDKEAYLTALGVVTNISAEEKELVIMDIGGASTELIKIKCHPFEIVSSLSLPLGAVRVTDWKKNHQFDFKMKEILAINLHEYKTNTLICVAGSMTSLATMLLGKKEFNDHAIDGLTIDFKQFNDFKDSILHKTTEELQHEFPFLGKRAPMVAAAAEMAVLILEKLEVLNLRVSTRGLRYGVVFQGHL